MVWGLANLTEEHDEGVYAIRHGREPVQDFATKQTSNQGGDNLFEKAFPCLFLYGQGDLQDHARWMLRYHDWRFRRHDTFPFVVFGIMQRRQALTLAPFKRDAHLHEDNHQADDNPAVRMLKKHIRAISSQVQGTNQSRVQLRSQIWATAIIKGPPLLWITINPCNLHDPVVQPSLFGSLLGPNKDLRARNVACDPYTSAEFFHFLMRTTFEMLFGVSKNSSMISVETGMAGKVSAFFGTVENLPGLTSKDDLQHIPNNVKVA
ncbi:hypothetical protein OG21DRAFT_1479690 [Imleria badia]|nr:hypothetical protein OG21DRAFT_1479690 [Imleria badia]